MTNTGTLSPRLAHGLVGLIWLAVCAIMILRGWSSILTLDYRDTDDALRLVQVRDLLAGQSFFDLVQHRFATATPVVMHWSRLVDVPIAIPIALLTPIAGTGAAERITLVTVPLVLLGGLMALLYGLRRPLDLSRATAVLACLLLATSLPILIQFTPLRIDHHGWQILMGAVALHGLLYPAQQSGKGALVAGLALAGWMQISMEGLPYAVAAGLIIAIGDLVRRDRLRSLMVYLAALTAASWLMLPLGHGGMAAFLPVCDAISPSLLIPLTTCCAVLFGARALLPLDLGWQRAMAMALAGAAGAITYVSTASACLAGPFETLTPLVYRLWYLGVAEGRPITTQTPALQAAILMPALFGAIGSALALRGAKTPQQRAAWGSLLAMQLFAFLVSLDVMRAMGFAHFTALPGNAWLLVRLAQRAQSLRAMPIRVIVTAATALFSPLGAASATAAILDASHNDTKQPGASTEASCTTSQSVAALEKVAPARILATLDVGPYILAATHNSIIGSGHHRNITGMDAVVRTFVSSPNAARETARRAGADFIVYCPGLGEVKRLAEFAPRGLMAMLEKDNVPGWLTRVPLQPSNTLRVYRVERTSR
ncbi:hypothetical protein [Sphingobium sp. CR28]|uniref:hypothetical protein n=1 Tax=Sphingobium sp. CR28 TaxID=3400272 RepID=UPI003FEF0640